MMQFNSLLTLILLTGYLTVTAQEYNPFESIGKKAKVLTLSNGKYVEFFDMDTIQRIGSVLFNIRQKKIVGLLNVDSVYTKVSDNSSASRWYSVDPLAEKYANVSPYVFVDNNPILKIDPDGRDWIISTTKNKDGSLHYNITFQAAVLNSSGSNINMKGFMKNEINTFKQLFGSENVTATLNLRQISSMDDLKGNEHLIEIMDRSAFKGTLEDGGYSGGYAFPGGKYIAINSTGIDAKTGAFEDKKTLSHEIGHTGGLLHPFEFDKKDNFLNGNPVPVDLQAFSNLELNPDKAANFMNYTGEAIKDFRTANRNDMIRYFNANATSRAGQVNQVIQNYNQGNLNNNNDVSARAILGKINRLFGVQ